MEAEERKKLEEMVGHGNGRTLFDTYNLQRIAGRI